jgi:hypothetical protein
LNGDSRESRPFAGFTIGIRIRPLAVTMYDVVTSYFQKPFLAIGSLALLYFLLMQKHKANVTDQLRGRCF